jgi:hypothetical protein
MLMVFFQFETLLLEDFDRKRDERGLTKRLLGMAVDFEVQNLSDV